MRTMADSTAPRRGPHVACIMDGNGRWAKRRGLPRTAGHTAGEEALAGVVRAAAARGVGHLTVFGFSTENWVRPPARSATSLLCTASCSGVSKS